MVKILFVCLGNICRSPAAEGVLIKMVKDAGLADKVEVASAGTSGYHSGSLPDSRMQQHGLKRGYEFVSLSQQFIADFFDHYDVIITMDQSNYRNVTALARNEADIKKVKPFSHYCCANSIIDVPDPYAGGSEGFEHVMDLMEDGCSEILRRLQDKESLL